MTPALSAIQTSPAFTIERRVKWGECDPAGIVYTPNLIDYAVDTARLFIRASFERELGRSDAAGLDLPVKSLSSVFHSALACDDDCILQAHFVRLGGSSFDVLVRAAHSGGRAAFEVTATFVSIASGPRRAVRLPDDVRAAIGRLIATRLPPAPAGR